MVLKNKADGRQVIQGLMRPAKIVFDEPLRKPPVELRGVRHHISHTEKLLLERAVEAFIDCIVFGSLCPRPVVLEAEFLAGIREKAEKEALLGARKGALPETDARR